MEQDGDVAEDQPLGLDFVLGTALASAPAAAFSGPQLNQVMSLLKAAAVRFVGPRQRIFRESAHVERVEPHSGAGSTRLPSLWRWRCGTETTPTGATAEPAEPTAATAATAEPAEAVTLATERQVGEAVTALQAFGSDRLGLGECLAKVLGAATHHWWRHGQVARAIQESGVRLRTNQGQPWELPKTTALQRKQSVVGAEVAVRFALAIASGTQSNGKGGVVNAVAVDERICQRTIFSDNNRQCHIYQYKA
jgi:hypothetical protein